MSRSTKRTNETLEGLKSENKELRATIKSLQRELKSLNKELKLDHNQDDLIKADIEDKKPKNNRCTQCERGVIKKTDLGPRTIESCTICEYRYVFKNAPKS